MAIKLGDDGTMDTVLYCDECGEEFRYSFMPGLEEETYEDFVDWAIEDAESEHECEGEKE